MQTATNVKQLIAEMQSMKRPRLAEVWEQTFGAPPHPKLWTELMRPVLAYTIQERAYGRRPSHLLQQLQKAHARGRGENRRSKDLRAGTRIVREWGGVIHEVQVTDIGFEYLGENYQSLSPIANKITGTRWSGPIFFGTKAKAGKK